MRHPAAMIVCLFAALPLTMLGCAEDEIEYREVKRPDELIRSVEWSAFVRIVRELPDPKLRQLASLQPPLPQWHQARTLPVNELAAEERSILDRSWDPPRLARELSRQPAIVRLIAAERMTVEQFVGLTLTIGAAMQRAQLSEDYPLDDLVRRGNQVMRKLNQDQRLFASLSIEDRHRVLDDAVWLHRVHRAQMLRAIPPSNVALVRRHAEFLRKIMPPRYERPPFEDVIDLLETEGLPFIEQPESGSDATIEWTPSEAIFGRSATPPRAL